MEPEYIEMESRPTNWVAILGVLIPAALVVGGSLISVAVNVSTLATKVDQVNTNLIELKTGNQREIDKLEKRITQLETERISAKK